LVGGLGKPRSRRPQTLHIPSKELDGDTLHRSSSLTVREREKEREQEKQESSLLKERPCELCKRRLRKAPRA
jgi:hypothetical protein